MFIGRKKELSVLNKEYSHDSFRFVVLYGRRRVGKTSLISKFLEGKKAIFYIATEQNDKLALENFSGKVLDVFPSAKSMIDTFPTWEKAFTYIAKEAKGERVILAMDEYPYLANSNSALSSILQKLIDTTFKNSRLFLLLCGSSMSFMEHQILGYQSPLYGRRTAQIKLEAFDFFESALFFPQFTLEEKMIAYAVFGGTPQYLSYSQESPDVFAAIHDNFLTKTGPLYEEPENLLKQELREPAIYNTIIHAIAKGSSKLNEIATKTGEDGKKCAKYLTSLISLQIIYKEYPVGRESERNGIYKLRDNMFKFWYRFIPQNNVSIEANHGQEVLQNRVIPNLNHYIGPIFEDVCRQYVMHKNWSSFLPFPFHTIGRWWGSNPVTKQQNEIDIVAQGDHRTLLGECKWTTEPVGKEVLEKMIAIASMVKSFQNQHYIVFSKSGFTNTLKTLSESKPNIQLINYDESFITLQND
jgi:AAA+ ATPase superfamily predicted ATPase